VATVTSTRGPLPAGGAARLFSVLLSLTPAEVSALDALPIQDGDLAAALMTVDFAPRRVRRRGNELGIDYVGDTNNATDVAELCRLAVESKLGTPQD